MTSPVQSCHRLGTSMHSNHERAHVRHQCWADLSRASGDCHRGDRDRLPPRASGAATDDDSKAHINATQSSTLGILALLLAFTFSLSLQRFDTRSDAMVDE